MVTVSMQDGSKTIGQVITEVANSYGVDPTLALATAWQESSLNQYAEGDWTGGSVGSGQPTSFGLFQLHKGGELGNLTEAQAFNPVSNATVAISEIASIISQYRGQGLTPGQLAALAQRPADEGTYATDVNNIYVELAHGSPPSGYTAAYNTAVNTSGPSNVPSSSSSSSKSTGSTGTSSNPSPSDAISGAGTGFLHEMQAILNGSNTPWYDWFLPSDWSHDIFAIVVMVIARTGVVLVGGGMVLLGVVTIIGDVTSQGSFASQTFRFLERGQSLTQGPQRVEQAQGRLLGNLRAEWNSENRLRASQGRDLISWNDFLSEVGIAT